MSSRPKRHVGPKGFLTTAHNFAENFLGEPADYRGAPVPQATRNAQNKHKRDRQRARGALLKAALNDEALRRMCRKAGISSTGKKEGESLYTELRRIVDVALFNIAKKMCNPLPPLQEAHRVRSHLKGSLCYAGPFNSLVP